MKSGSVRWKPSCCVRWLWLRNRRRRPSTAQRRKGQGWPWMRSTSAGSVENSWIAHEKATSCYSLVFSNHFKIAVPLKLHKPQGCTAVSRSVAFWTTFKSPLILMQRAGFLLAACGLLAAWESTRDAITPCWSLRGTVTKPETTWAKLGTYSLKLW